MTIKEQNGSLRIEDIPDIMSVRDELKKRGFFDPSFTFYSTSTGLGDIIFKTTWWANAVDVSIKKKPMLIPEKLVFQRLRQEIAKANLPA